VANRNFNRKQALEHEIKEIYATVSIGGTGAPTLTSKVGVTSITRNGAGDYTVVLDDKYNSLKMAEVSHLATSAQDLNFQLHSETVSSTKTVRILCLTGATPTDPASGTIVRIKLDLKNTSVI
jgi:hypothetical protein